MQRVVDFGRIFLGLVVCSVVINGNTARPGNGIVISLGKFNGSGQAFRNDSVLEFLSESSIDIEDVPPAVAYIIIQVHTHESDVMLFSKSNVTLNVTGYNVGLYISASDISAMQLAVVNDNNRTVPVVVAAVAYTNEAPIPGGCNMEANIKIAPFQELTSTDALVRVNAPSASTPLQEDELHPCGNNSVTYESFRLYIPSGDFSDETYFSAIAKMMTVDGIITNGEKVLTGVFSSPLSRSFSAYPGTGSVYAMVATYGNYSAAYIPSFSYACGQVSSPETCYLLKTPLSKVICAGIFFMGISLTFFGHRCISFQIMLLGSITGGIIGNTILTAVGVQDVTLEMVLPICIGLAFGICFAMCWCADKPCPAIVHATFTLGALIASITYLGMPDEIFSFKNDAAFWSIYVGICLTTVLILCACSMTSIMICHSVLGSYAIISPIDYWLGSNLKYIIINTVRRINVPGFNVVTINPPIRTADILLSVLWVFLAVLGFYIQRRGLNGRLLFPRRGKYTTVYSRGDYPLLSAERGNRRVVVLRRSDDVYRSTY